MHAVIENGEQTFYNNISVLLNQSARESTLTNSRFIPKAKE